MYLYRCNTFLFVTNKNYRIYYKLLIFFCLNSRTNIDRINKMSKRIDLNFSITYKSKASTHGSISFYGTAVSHQAFAKLLDITLTKLLNPNIDLRILESNLIQINSGTPTSSNINFLQKITVSIRDLDSTNFPTTEDMHVYILDSIQFIWGKLLNQLNSSSLSNIAAQLESLLWRFELALVPSLVEMHNPISTDKSMQIEVILNNDIILFTLNEDTLKLVSDGITTKKSS